MTRREIDQLSVQDRLALLRDVQDSLAEEREATLLERCRLVWDRIEYEMCEHYPDIRLHNYREHTSVQVKYLISVRIHDEWVVGSSYSMIARVSGQNAQSLLRGAGLIKERLASVGRGWDYLRDMDEMVGNIYERIFGKEKSDGK